jgi:hypothetical protein
VGECGSEGPEKVVVTTFRRSRSPKMPRKRSARIPKYRLYKPTGLAVVRLNGRDIYLGKHGSDQSHEGYEQVIAEWLANRRQLAVRREQRESSAPAQ